MGKPLSKHGINIGWPLVSRGPRLEIRQAWHSVISRLSGDGYQVRLDWPGSMSRKASGTGCRKMRKVRFPSVLVGHFSETLIPLAPTSKDQAWIPISPPPDCNPILLLPENGPLACGSDEPIPVGYSFPTVSLCSGRLAMLR